MLKYTITLLAVLFSSIIWSFPCKVTVMKDSCWANSPYHVIVDVFDSGAQTPTPLLSINLPANEKSVTQSFECKPAQILTYKARFEPAIWEQDKGKIYFSKSSKSLPSAIQTGDSAWQIAVCFSDDFSGVPIPPQATANCHCDYSSLSSSDKK